MNAPADEALERITRIFDNAIARERAKQARFKKEVRACHR
jgi:hypothetical protein